VCMLCLPILVVITTPSPLWVTLLVVWCTPSTYYVDNTSQHGDIIMKIFLSTLFFHACFLYLLHLHARSSSQRQIQNLTLIHRLICNMLLRAGCYWCFHPTLIVNRGGRSGEEWRRHSRTLPYPWSSNGCVYRLAISVEASAIACLTRKWVHVRCCPSAQRSSLCICAAGRLPIMSSQAGQTKLWQQKKKAKSCQWPKF
jgi:hypothetical protein